jgi:peptidoglycan/LPS O-acetylase OafA/YrhL
MQLFAVLLAILWLNNKLRLSPQAAIVCVAALVLASLLHFNRDSDWDNWAVYFFGAYGLGALTHWLSCNPSRTSRWIPMALIVAVTVAALVIDFRARIALALAVSLLLFWAQMSGWLFTWPRSKVLTYLSKISYSVFLLNFPVALVVNAWFTRFATADAWVQTTGVLVAWIACNLAGALFYALVEQRAHRLARGGRHPQAVPAGA